MTELEKARERVQQILDQEEESQRNREEKGETLEEENSLSPTTPQQLLAPTYMEDSPHPKENFVPAKEVEEPHDEDINEEEIILDVQDEDLGNSLSEQKSSLKHGEPGEQETTQPSAHKTPEKLSVKAPRS